MRSAKILVVDDEPAVRSFLRDMLTYEGRQIVTAESGEEALKHIADQEFDLVLLDLKMKTIGGIEVLADLHRRWPDTAVIVLTAHASLETAVEAVRRGACDYLFKPCKMDKLQESVEEALRARQKSIRQREVLDRVKRSLSDNLEDLSTLSARPSPKLEEDGRTKGNFLEWGNLVIDLTRHTATLNGHMLELSPTQFDMLAYLVEEAPRVIPPEELVREVREYEGEPGREEARNIVRSHIYQIREHIEAACGQRSIVRTVRGVGYAISEVVA